MVSTHCSEVISQRRSSVHVKPIDASYLDVAIFSLFKIDIINFLTVKSILAKEFNIQPSELENMPAWEYELFVKEINKIVKEENERNKQEMDKAGVKDAQKMSNPNNLKKMQQAATPKMPNMNMPNITINSGMGGMKK
jgi:hypothetical protein